MTSSPGTRPITDIPAEDIEVEVEWQDRLGTNIPHQDTDTHWSVEDEHGGVFSGATVEPILDGDRDETGTLTFSQSQGTFRVVAETPGAGGSMVRAQSDLYNIRPGAPAMGKITLHVQGGGGGGSGGGGSNGGTHPEPEPEPEPPDARRHA